MQQGEDKRTTNPYNASRRQRSFQFGKQHKHVRMHCLLLLAVCLPAIFAQVQPTASGPQAENQPGLYGQGGYGQGQFGQGQGGFGQGQFGQGQGGFGQGQFGQGGYGQGQFGQGQFGQGQFGQGQFGQGGQGGFDPGMLLALFAGYDD
ncbi:hypothetical protein V1264_009395 [Littorina saxatilis]|uniref:Uncharacterized protein n=1 Tax=Littorina saxatilis TaxID=31220 RepID=A0AAN9ARN3_9CAEN